MAAFNSKWTIAALAMSAALAAFALATHPAGAQSCASHQDAGGGCARDGVFACSPPAGGKCWTVKQERVVKCLCTQGITAGGGAPHGGGVPRGGGLSTNPPHGGFEGGVEGERKRCQNRCIAQQQACLTSTRSEPARVGCNRKAEQCERECDRTPLRH
jgi:hypothetical protein